MRSLRQWLAVVALVGLIVASLSPVKVEAAGIRVLCDGVAVSFDTPPQVIAGRTMIPVRKVSEALGATVGWDDRTKSAIITLDTRIVKVTLDSTTAYVNGEPSTLDVPPQVVGGRTMVPLRFIGEALLAKIGWHGPTQTVSVSSPGNVMTISSGEGTVEVLKLGSKAWEWKSVGAMEKGERYLIAGERVRTGEQSTAILTLSDGTSVRVDPGSELYVTSLRQDKATRVRTVELEAFKGSVWLEVAKQIKGSSIKLKSGSKTYTAYGTVFGVEAGDNPQLLVIAGTVLADPSSGQGPTVAVPTGTAMASGADAPALMTDAQRAALSGMSDWAMNAITDTAKDASLAQIAAAEAVKSLPASESAALQANAQVLQTAQELSLAFQFELRQSAPILGEAPPADLQKLVVQAQQRVQDVVTQPPPAAQGVLGQTDTQRILELQAATLAEVRHNAESSMAGGAEAQQIATAASQVEGKLPSNISLPPELVPSVPLPQGVKPAEISIPAGINLPPGMVLPPGIRIDAMTSLPEGVVLPPQANLMAGASLPPGVQVPPGFSMPPGMTLPRDAVLPPGFQMPEGMALPPGVSLPRGFELPPGMSLPSGAQLPPGFSLPAGVELPLGISLPPGFTPPAGWTPPPGVAMPSAGDQMPSWMNLDPASLTQGLGFGNLPASFQAGGPGFTPPSGWTPPTDYAPPPGWTQPAGWVPQAGEIPAGWTQLRAGPQTYTVDLPGGYAAPPGWAPLPGWTPPPDWNPVPGEPPPGWLQVGTPPENSPTGTMPGMPPGGVLPGGIPPGVIPPGVIPPGVIPPGVIPPGVIPPGAIPPGGIPPQPPPP
ncbi:MAG: stalk domain-containing protein [Bacillota bacterium]